MLVVPESFTEHHTHMNVLQIKNHDGHVPTENTNQQDDVSLDILKHEGDTYHLSDQHQNLYNHPVQRFALDLRGVNHFPYNALVNTFYLVIVLLLQLQLTVQLGHRVENLSKVGALEDPKENCNESIAED